MQLFYNDSLYPQVQEVTFDKEESNHIHKVLRKKTGDLLHITDGRGYLYEAQIQYITDKKCTAHILSHSLAPTPAYHLHIAVAPTKMNERYEWFLEKATEIGVHEVTPILCDHSERKTIKTERFEKILLSAMKQSLQYYKPQLNPPISLLEWLDTIESNSVGRYVAHCQEGARGLLLDRLEELPRETTNLWVLIGPEGDFSQREIQKACSKGFLPVSLSPNRLRTETAAIVACSCISDIFQRKK
ncbi:16S rRNA (uracil(1498)-N(3))-methyltransferase [Capnocytophaga gingivalis]|uniref:16S rRNA (uracil(1498)-N(3))-methyltransferase n=1 Tax=Capnocytophaga gingivalis TaxID=1017 RepID=UPI0028D28CE7|nr:16S rRNA (uracil(1498)-N(3))-methyltransferase [Capnocytophaga gingivalis]